MDISLNNTKKVVKNTETGNYLINSKLKKGELTPTKIKKMLFIYNALSDGWTVKCIGKDQFEFLKPTVQLKKEINLDDCLKHFITKNLIE